MENPDGESFILENRQYRVSYVNNIKSSLIFEGVSFGPNGGSVLNLFFSDSSVQEKLIVKGVQHLSLSLNNRSVLNKILLQQVKSIEIIFDGHSAVTESLEFTNCRSLSGEIKFKDLNSVIKESIIITSCDLSCLRCANIKVKEDFVINNDSGDRITDLHFHGNGYVGSNVQFLGGRMIKAEIKDLSIGGSLKLGPGMTLEKEFSYVSSLVSEKAILGGDFIIESSLKYDVGIDSSVLNQGNDYEALNLYKLPTVQIEGIKHLGDIKIEDLLILAKFRYRRNEVNGKQFLTNVTFKNLADFYGSTFHKGVNFFKCNFEGVAVFSDATFHNNLLFTFSEFKSHLIFRGTKFIQNKEDASSPKKPGLDLSTAILPEKVYFQYVELGYFDCVNHDINDAARTPEDGYGITHKNRKDTFRIIKKYAKENDDYYELSEFGYLEAKAKQEMLEWEIKQKKNSPELIDKSLTQLLQDKWIHVLNDWSNRHRTSWLSSIGFIGLVTLISWIVIIRAGWLGNYDSTIFDRCDCYEDYLKVYFNLLNPLHNLDIYKGLSGFDANILVVVLDLASRIFVGYGYYQFVQAFRRFK